MLCVLLRGTEWGTDLAALPHPDRHCRLPAGPPGRLHAAEEGRDSVRHQGFNDQGRQAGGAGHRESGTAGHPSASRCASAVLAALFPLHFACSRSAVAMHRSTTARSVRRTVHSSAGCPTVRQATRSSSPTCSPSTRCRSSCGVRASWCCWSKLRMRPPERSLGRGTFERRLNQARRVFCRPS